MRVSETKAREYAYIVGSTLYQRTFLSSIQIMSIAIAVQSLVLML